MTTTADSLSTDLARHFLEDQVRRFCNDNIGRNMSAHDWADEFRAWLDAERAHRDCLADLEFLEGVEAS